MRFNLTLLSFSILLILPATLFAQNYSKPINFYEKYPFMQDRQGYIWYAENSGRIGKYLDGDRQSDADLFEEFTGCDFTNIIKEDAEGKVWIASGCRFTRFDPVTKKFEDIQQAVIKQTRYTPTHVESSYEDPDGTIWFGGNALIGYGLKTRKITVYNNPDLGPMTFNLFGGSDHTVWFTSSGSMLKFNHYDPLNNKLIKSFEFETRNLALAGAFMTANVKTEPILGGQDGTYFTYIGGRICEFNANAGTLIPLYLPVEFGTAIELSNDAINNYVSTDNGSVLKYNKIDKTFMRIWQHPGKKSADIMFRAKFGTGIFLWADNALFHVSSSPALFNKAIALPDSTSMTRKNTEMVTLYGKVFVQENERLLPVNELYRNDTILIHNPQPAHPIIYDYTSANVPGENNFWQMLRGYPFQAPRFIRNLVLKDSLGNVLKTYRSQILDTMLRNAFCSDLQVAPDGNIWVMNSSGVICQFNSKTEEFRMLNIRELEPLASRKLMIDNKNNLWISNSARGISVYDPRRNSFREFHHDPLDSASLSSENVTSIFQTSAGKIWVGTKSKGVSILDPVSQKFVQLDKRHGLPELIISDIAEDKNGTIWVSTLQYICRWLPAGKKFIVYGNEDGLGFRTAFVRKIFYPEKNGLLYIRGEQALFSLHPDTILRYHPIISPVLFTSFSISNKLVNPADADSVLSKAIDYTDLIKLDYGQNSFSFQYAAVDFYGSINYAYRLAGFQTEWQLVDGKTEAIYTNIPPGDYTFQVKAANRQGLWSAVREIRVFVKAPWYRTWIAYALYAIIFGLGISIYIRYRSRHLVIENQLLEEKVIQRTNELSSSLQELKETQAQLVQREKMASLGELTAGIAHEIQNPLNFVNNFSDVNSELIDEAVEENDKGNAVEVKGILKTLKENEDKINHHGKRADAIVKGMLQHSRSSTGEKTLTDINALAEEYLRLAYHGLRSKDKSFNLALQTDFDSTIGTININPQDIGRVLLNLYNNAFYAVNEKKKLNIAGYEPAVAVSTKRSKGKVEVKVRDNGSGIDHKILQKIFQPFFTTKPTGQGTGLGLSLSYDIVKAGGGEIKVDSRLGEYTEFIISLPA